MSGAAITGKQLNTDPNALRLPGREASSEVKSSPYERKPKSSTPNYPQAGTNLPRHGPGFDVKSNPFARGPKSDITHDKNPQPKPEEFSGPAMPKPENPPLLSKEDAKKIAAPCPDCDPANGASFHDNHDPSRPEGSKVEHVHDDTCGHLAKSENKEDNAHRGDEKSIGKQDAKESKEAVRSEGDRSLPERNHQEVKSSANAERVESRETRAIEQRNSESAKTEAPRESAVTKREIYNAGLKTNEGFKAANERKEPVSNLPSPRRIASAEREFGKAVGGSARTGIELVGVSGKSSLAGRNSNLHDTSMNAERSTVKNKDQPTIPDPNLQVKVPRSAIHEKQDKKTDLIPSGTLKNASGQEKTATVETRSKPSGNPGPEAKEIKVAAKTESFKSRGASLPSDPGEKTESRRKVESIVGDKKGPDRRQDELAQRSAVKTKPRTSSAGNGVDRDFKSGARELRGREKSSPSQSLKAVVQPLKQEMTRERKGIQKPQLQGAQPANEKKPLSEPRSLGEKRGTSPEPSGKIPKLIDKDSIAIQKKILERNPPLSFNKKEGITEKGDLRVNQGRAIEARNAPTARQVLSNKEISLLVEKLSVNLPPGITGKDLNIVLVQRYSLLSRILNTDQRAHMVSEILSTFVLKGKKRKGGYEYEDETELIELMNDIPSLLSSAEQREFIEALRSNLLMVEKISSNEKDVSSSSRVDFSSAEALGEGSDRIDADEGGSIEESGPSVSLDIHQERVSDGNEDNSGGMVGSIKKGRYCPSSAF